MTSDAPVQPTSRTIERRTPTSRQTFRTVDIVRSAQTAILHALLSLSLNTMRSLYRYIPCVESVSDGTETRAVVDNNIQASFNPFTADPVKALHFAILA